MGFLKKLELKTQPIPNHGKFVVCPTMRTIYRDVDGACYQAPSDILCRRAYKMEPNHYTIILPGLTEWAERYRQAYDAELGSVKADFDWRDWHRDGLIFTKEIYRRLPRHIPVYYAKPAGDDSGLVEDFEVTEERIDAMLNQIPVSHTQRDPVVADSVVVGVKEEDGDLCIRLKIKGKFDTFTFGLEYENLELLKSFLERLVQFEGQTVAWESGQGDNGMYFYPQTIGGLKHMGQLHIYTEGKSKADFTAYVNIRHFIRSVYRTVMTNLGHVDGEAVYKKMQSNMLEWYIDDVRYDEYSFLRNKPSLAKWLSPAIMQVKDFFTNFYDSIYDEDV